MKRKYIYIILIIAIGLFILWTGFLWKIFSCGIAGSYACVETWTLNAKESEVIAAIKELKKENPSLQPPDQTELTFKRDTGYNWNTCVMIEYKKKLKTDSTTPLPEHNYQNSYTDYWLYIDFYYPDTKEIVYTWTRPDFDSSMTTFAFVGISSYKIKPRPTTDSLLIKLGLDSSQAVDENNENNDFKEINRDYGYFANKRQIWKFENRIVDPIRQKIEKKKKSSI